MSTKIRGMLESLELNNRHLSAIFQLIECASLFTMFNKKVQLLEGVECWSAREMQEIFKYAEWRNFLKVIDKAKASCENSGESVPNHFVDINKMVAIGSGAERPVDDIALTRYACYLNF
jgi:DNA-damage-inducible protein D